MDETTEQLLARLEQATAAEVQGSETPDAEMPDAEMPDAEMPDAEMPVPLDDETALLRESWLALGKLLDAADMGIQESEVGSQESGLALRQLLEAADAESPGGARPRPTPRAGLPLRLIAALAASLLVAVAAWTIMKRGTDSIEPAQELAVPTELPAPAPRIADVAEAPQEGDSADIVDEFAWEDSFDEQLAATSQAIRSVRADWNGGDRRYSVLLDQLEQFNEELSEGSL